MPLRAFSFPVPETRFFKAGSFIYKFKIRGGSGYSGEEHMGGSCFNLELEEIIRTVLGNLDSLQPFCSTHFIVFPYKKRWEGVSKVMCKHGERKLSPYPFILILYLETNMQSGKQAEKKLSPSKRRKRDSPLEEAIIKDLIKDLEAESKLSVVGRLHVDKPAGGEVKEDPGHVGEKGTKVFDGLKHKSGVNTVRGAGTPGTVQAMGEEEGDEEGHNADSAPGTPVRPGFLTRLASIFPLSMFFRDP